VPETSYWPLLGRKVRGGVSFKFDLDMTKLLDALDKIIERFDSNEHRTRWPQANNLVPVRDEAVVDQLDALLDGVLGAPHPENSITLAAPTERSGDKPYPQHFVIGRMRASPPTAPYLTYAGWKSLVQSKGDTANLEAARRREFICWMLIRKRSTLAQCMPAWVLKSPTGALLMSCRPALGTQQTANSSPAQTKSWGQLAHRR